MYMSTLEWLNHNAPYDFWLTILFGAGLMVAGYVEMGLSPRFLGHNLSTFLVYVWSRYHKGLEVNIYHHYKTNDVLRTPTVGGPDQYLGVFEKNRYRTSVLFGVKNS